MIDKFKVNFYLNLKQKIKNIYFWKYDLDLIHKTISIYKTAKVSMDDHKDCILYIHNMH